LIIAVTGLNTASDPSSGYGVIKSLKKANREDFKIAGLAYEPYETSLYNKDLADKAFLIPSPNENRKEFIKRISSIKSGYGLDILIPNLAFDIPAVADLAPQLKRMGINTLLPGRNILNKVMGQTTAQNQADPEATSLPGNRATGRDQALFASLVKNPVQSPSAVSAFSPDMFSTALLANRESNLAGIVSVKKLVVSKGGSMWMGLSVETGDFALKVEKFVKETGWVGPMTINTVGNERGLSYISGIHPGFPDWINFAAGAGVNLPATLIGILTGKEIHHSAFRAEPGRLFVRMSVDIVTDINRFGAFSLTGELET
jgi:hypothetical protein